jgi:hypothetical protein
MTKTFDFTENEAKAVKLLYAECLSGMGGSCYADLESDPYTWAYPDTLTANGWSKKEAGGTFASLVVKGALCYEGKPSRDIPEAWSLNMDAALWASQN